MRNVEADLQNEENGVIAPERDDPEASGREAVDRVWSYTYSYLLGAFLLIALIWSGASGISSPTRGSSPS